VAKVAPTRKGRQPAPTDELRIIPGVGPSIAIDLRELGIRKVADLKGKDPERMYRRLIQLRGEHQDRCLLYVFRSAIYFASTANPRPELLDWWRWKDQR
jgi:DNA polymerase/3'-5' exonuclease PolX